MSEPLIKVLHTVVDAIDGSASISNLRKLRDQLDSWLLRDNIRKALHGLNSLERISAIRDCLRAIQRKAEELLSARDNEREIVRLVGLGGGTGLVGGAMVTALTMSFPAIAIIPAAGGVYMMWRARIASRSFTEEMRLLEQIAEIASELATG